MPNQFTVPQFLDVESKIIGPVTARQFFILLGVLLAEFLIYRIFLNIIYVLLFGLPVLGVGLIFAFGKANGQPIHFLVLNYIQTFRRPRLRVWDKTLSDADVRMFLQTVEEEVIAPRLTKAPLERSRLNELTLTVNTGGVYASDEETS